ncbi:hypothetical protein ACXHXG_28110 [Rhizobium sp. LEGMi198b]|uniref:hypothetical protein n=1 Tax=unclassified Rhizobium TaxID=2613769 RepID=UPI000CDF3B48|nr:MULTISPECIES: hypothetical protein [Rhizobium]AVA21514.1 hypothetical protein NXC24_CH01873 [Rhizobium sp. NXC24]MDK4737461.1 hypothetical protein [Rhizobium sp. CNPSo 3464]UWU22610.1 hypothetical protein N2601_06545 [Rhizobium tropici]WFU03398.1 hypothetical protein QA648_06490 [Rhizobium sp. CB3171]
MTQSANQTPGRKVIRGRPYSIAEFARKYRLDDKEAKRLFDKFGPSATELDLLMAAKRKPPSLSSAIGY